MKKIFAFLLLLNFIILNMATNTVYAQDDQKYLGEIVNKNTGFLINNNTDFTLDIETIIRDNFTKEKNDNADRDIHIDVFKNKKLFQSDIFKTTNNHQEYTIKTKKMKSKDKVKIKISLYKDNKKLSHKNLSFSILSKNKYKHIDLVSPKSYEWNLKKRENVNILMQMRSVSNKGKKTKLTKPVSLSIEASDNKTYTINKIKGNKYKINLNASFISNDIKSITFTPVLKNSNIPLVSNTTQLNIERNIPISELSFSNGTYTLDKKETFKLVPLYKPLDSDEIHNLTWTSSDDNIVRVSEDGTLTAINKGEVSVKVAGKKVNKEIAVKVIQSLKSIKTSDKEYSVDVEDTFEIPYKLNPIDTDITKDDINITSEDSKIVEVIDSTKIKGVNPGKTTLSIRYADIETKVIIYVQPQIEKIEVDKEKYYLSPDETISLPYTITPSLSSFSKKPKIIVKSENPDIIEVTKDNKIKGIKPGEGTISIRYKDIVQNVKVEVSIPKEELPLKEKVVKISRDTDLSGLIDVALNELTSVKSNDDSIVSINNNTIKIHNDGETYLTIETEDKIGILTVIVNKPSKESQDIKPKETQNKYFNNHLYVCYPKDFNPKFKILFQIK